MAKVIMLFEYEGFTRFEVTRIISARTLQLAMGAPPLVRHVTSARDLAMKEFDSGVLPITVRRQMPSA
ncbi:MAG: DNA-directed RNA polymerase subunit K [Candidatus Aenigmarchaeota archaeon]|nr:DNA-directed RNA polymerase subunit K [Candidatus Aenigmarchaeota archaeon]